MNKVVCFGEVLWDVFQNHKKIGGAPLNVGVRLKSLNNDVSIISRVGADDNGNKILIFLNENNVNTDGVQIDSNNNTGEVKVTLNEKGSASYDIIYPMAWDKIKATETIENITKASDAFIYGSLITRDEESKNTLYKLLSIAKYKIFDVNLRAPYYTKEVLLFLMNQADFIKFNDDEIFEIAKYLNSDSDNLEENIHFIVKETNTKTICVTKGSQGAVLYYNKTFYYNSGYQIEVADTVGAGDSFLASIVDKLLKNTPPQDALNFACAVGAVVASSEGANSKIDEETIEEMINT